VKVTINIRKKIRKKNRVIQSIDKVLSDLDHAEVFAARSMEKYKGDSYTIYMDGKRVG